MLKIYLKAVTNSNSRNCLENSVTFVRLLLEKTEKAERSLSSVIMTPNLLNSRCYKCRISNAKGKPYM